MIRALVLVCLLFTQATASADEEYVRADFWVLGSFTKADSAHAEMERLVSELGRPVEVRFDDNLDVFRVMTPAAETTREDLGGLDTWLLSLEVPASEVQALLTRDSSARDLSTAEDDEPPIIIEAPPEEPLYPEFVEGESLYEYCARLPDARLCQHPRIEAALKTDRVLAQHRGKLENVCDQITHPEWLQTCKRLYPED